MTNFSIPRGFQSCGIFDPSLASPGVLVLGSWELFPKNGAEYQMQLFCLLPQDAGFGAETLFGSCHHSQKEFGFFGFLATRAYFVSKIPFRDCIIRFAIVRANTGACAHQLINQPIIDRVLRYCLREANYGFTDPTGALFQIILRRSLATFSIAVPQKQGA